jgi:hypothetical protein
MYVSLFECIIFEDNSGLTHSYFKGRVRLTLKRLLTNRLNLRVRSLQCQIASLMLASNALTNSKGSDHLAPLRDLASVDQWVTAASSKEVLR